MFQARTPHDQHRRQLCCVGLLANLWLRLLPSADVNTATAVELIIMTTFLQNTKRRHRVYMRHCSTAVNQLDLELDLRLAAASGEKVRSSD